MRRRLAYGVVLIALSIPAAVAAWVAVDQPSSEPSQEQVIALHASLHRMERVCARKNLTASDTRMLESAARSFVRLYRAYPDARFQIDDESGRMLSVLLVARAELRTCSAGPAAIVDRALPAQFRDSN